MVDNINVNMGEIPIVDLISLSGKYEDLDSAAFAKVSEAIGTAMSTVGFVYLTNHGVDMDKIDHIHKLSKDLFLLPTKTKLKYRKTNAPECFHGYAGPGDELQDLDKKNSTELRESFDVWGFEQHDEKYFPSEVPGYKLAYDSVRPECNNLGKKLLRMMAKFLNLVDEEYFVKAHRFMDDPSIRTQSQYKVHYYYPMEPNDPDIPPNAIRCGEHCDWGTITLLFQDMVGGLEVQRLDGTWIDAVPIKDSILVNVAQLMELWSGGIFPATPHRVRIRDEERTREMYRQSFIYFINPDGDTEVKTIVPCPPGDKKYLQRTEVAYDFYKGMITEITKHNGSY